MSHNFKPGDMALFIGKGFSSLSTGSVVTLEEFVPEGTCRHMPENPVESRYFHAPCDCWLVSNGGLNRYITAASKLMPLRGDFAPERQKSQEVPA